MRFKIIERNEKFGITENGVVVVPIVHSTKNDAVDEWTYYQGENIKYSYLSYKLTPEQIQDTKVAMLQYKPLTYWKENAEEDYMTTPISVLRYITELENRIWYEFA